MNAMMMMMYAAMLDGGATLRNTEHLERNYETNEQRERRLIEAEIRNNIKRGMKPFEYGDVIIWAINKKNADRKFNTLSNA